MQNSVVARVLGIALLLATPLGATEPELSTAENLSEAAPCEQLLERTQHVSLVNFVLRMARARGNIHRLVEGLETRYGKVNFDVVLPFSSRRIFILQERDLISSVMRKDARLPYVNKNFDLSHGHFHSINSVDTTDALWKDLHADLFEIFKHKKITDIMEKHKDILVGRSSYNLNDTLEEYFLRVWGEYCFGEMPPERFTQMRERLVTVLGKVFHSNRFNRLPLLGHYTSVRNRQRFAEELKQVDVELAEILKSSIAQKQGVFYELYARLVPKYPNAFQIALDNSFLGVLVYDFIYIVILDALTHMAKFPERDRHEQVRQSRHNGFLYPYRFREVAEDFDEFRKGDFCILNLQKSGLYFSSGPRACPRRGTF